MKAKASPRIAELNSEEGRLFFEEIGKMLFNALPISVQCGHEHPKNTVLDYYRVGSNESKVSGMAVDFLSDFFNMPGKSLIEKWIGGDSDVMMAWSEQALAAKR